MTNAEAPPLHRNAFDHLRLLAAWCVLISHQFSLSGHAEPQVLGYTLGAVAVGVFFALSGYLVSQSLQLDPHVGRFLVRRALRILPALAVNLLFCVFVVGLAFTTLPAAEYLRHAAIWHFLAANLAFSPQFALPGLWPDAIQANAVNGSLWTLPFEVLAYLVLAALAAVAGRHLRWLSPLLLVLSLLATQLWHAPQPIVVWDNDLRHVPIFMALFFAGATLAHHGQRLLDTEWLLWLLAAYVLVDLEPLRALLTLLIVPALAIHVGRRRPPRRALLANDVSYGVYLYAYPIQQAVINEGAGLAPWSSLALSAALTYVCARLSWSVVERRALRLKPRRRAGAVVPGPAPP